MHLVVIGGGAAGFFGALAAAEARPDLRVTILERGKAVLQKVKVSGGGRCNATHACYDPRLLTQFYPRGGRELLGPFTRFGPEEVVEWFAQRDVILKTESDGRMFPESDNSQTIIDCFLREAARLKVKVELNARVNNFRPAAGASAWEVELQSGAVLKADAVLLTTGSSEAVWEMLRQLGHSIEPPVPSLFTFNTKDSRLRDLSGLSVPAAALRVPTLRLTAEGPLLITHWGLSGPAVLRLSAWGARDLARENYKFPLVVNWLGQQDEQEVMEHFLDLKLAQGKKQVAANPQFALPLRLWQHLVEAAGVLPELRWADAGKKQLTALASQLTAGLFPINGKSTFKEEFVTAGGVSLREVDFKTFQSKLLPRLFFAGEVLDIDAITGGFNFQAAWTGGWISGQSIAGLD